MGLELNWRKLEEKADGSSYIHIKKKITAIRSVAKEADGKQWLHVSLAGKNGIPTWDELSEVKSVFVGDDKTCYQVLPTKDEWVNLHPWCLHLWHCVDGDPLPKFAGFVNGVKSI